MRVVAWILLALAGLLSYGVHTDTLAEPHPPELGTVSENLAGLTRVEDVTFDEAVLGELPPEEHLFRRYRDADGREGLLYMAYFLRGKRWSGRPHPVDVCYLSQGWETLDKRLQPCDSGAEIWIQSFGRKGETIRVAHWLQRPGDLPRMGMLQSLRARLGRFTNLRQDVASIYLEFPADACPADGELAQAADQLIGEVEVLWR